MLDNKIFVFTMFLMTGFCAIASFCDSSILLGTLNTICMGYWFYQLTQ